VDDFGVKVRMARKSLHMTQIALAEKIGVDRKTIGEYEAGKYKPDMDNGLKLADVLNLSLDDMYGKAEVDKSLYVIEKIYALEDVHQPARSASVEWLPRDWPAADTYFAIRVHGDAMEPVMCDHNVAICKAQDYCAESDYAVVLLPGKYAMIRKVQFHGDMIVLVPVNTQYPTEIVSIQSAKIIGVLKELRSRF